MFLEASSGTLSHSTRRPSATAALKSLHVRNGGLVGLSFRHAHLLRTPRMHWSSGIEGKIAFSGRLLLWALEPRAPAAVLDIAGPPAVGSTARAFGSDARTAQQDLYTHSSPSPRHLRP